MDFEQLKWVWSLLQWIVVAGCALFTYLTNKDAANQKDVAALSERVGRAEAEMKNMATAADVNNLGGDIKGMQVSIEGMHRSFDALNRNLERVNDYLMRKN